MHQNLQVFGLSLFALVFAVAGFAQPTVSSTTPTTNTRDAAVTTNISAAFSQNMNAASASSFAIHRSQSRHIGGSYGGQNTSTLSFNPTNNFQAGERVRVSLSSDLESSGSVALSTPRAFEFLAAAGTGPAYFVDSTTNLSLSRTSNAIVVADFNGDSFLDIAVANQSSPNTIYFQNAGVFTAGGTFGAATSPSFAMDVGDVNGDGHLDIALGNFGAADRIFINNGAGQFSTFNTVGGSGTSTTAIKLADFDADGDLDILSAYRGQQCAIFANDGNGAFTNLTNVGIPSRLVNAAEVADFDNDGDFDIVMVSTGNTSALGQNEIFLNNGSGTGFTPVAFGSGTDASTSVAAGDIDSDGDMDIIVGTGSSADSLAYTNNGSGTLTVAHSFTGFTSTTSVMIFDADGDGDMDVALGSSANPDAVFLGNASGTFGTARNFGSINTKSMDSADIDGDGDLDIITAVQSTQTPNRIHFNEIGAQTLAHSASPSMAHEGIGNITITVARNGSSTGAASVDYTTNDITATNGSDYTTTSGTLNWANGDGNAKTFTIPVSEDAMVEMNETFNVVLSNASGVAISSSTIVVTILDNDTEPTVAFAQVAPNVNEDAGNAVIQVELSAPYQQTASVAFASGGGSATAGVDYTAVNGSLTFTPDETSKTFNVPIVDDSMMESSESITLTISGPSNSTLGTATVAVLTILDNDSTSQTLSFANASISVAESGTMATVTIKMNQTSTSAVTVDYATSDSTASAGSDYTAASGTLTFAPMEVAKSFNVAISDDMLDEDDEVITITISNAMGASLPATATASITITDDDASPSVGVAMASLSVAEDVGNASISVTLSEASGRPVSVNYATSDTSTTAGSDYTVANGVLTFAVGETTKVIMVSVTDDSADENAESLVLTLSSPSNASLGSATTTITINDNDNAPSVAFTAASASIDEDMGPAIIAVQLSTASGKTITVDYASTNGTAIAGSDFTAITGTLTFMPGEVAKNLTLPVTDDGFDESDETLTLTLSSPTQSVLGTDSSLTLTIVDDEVTPTVSFDSATASVMEDDGSLMLAVSLSNASAVALSVSYASAVGTADASDFTATSGTLMFAAMQTTLNITIPILDNAIFEASEIFTISLSMPSSGLLLGATTQATITIDDDEAQPTIGFTSAASSLGEGAASAMVSLTLSGLTQDNVSVEVSAAGTSAASPEDFDAITSQMVTISAGMTSATFALALKEDLLDEDDETIALSLANPTIAALGTDTATFTILDDDAMPTLSFESSTLSATEDGGAISVKVELSSASGRALNVDYATSNASAMEPLDYTQSMGTLNFAAGETEKTFMLAILDDGDIEGSETFRVTLSSPTNATLGLAPLVTITILDDESPPELVFGQTMPNALENLATLDVEVRLSKASGLTVTVDFATSNGTAQEPADYSAQSGTLTFLPSETTKTVSIVLVDDALIEDNETLTLTLSNPSNATIAAPANATLTILEDDLPQVNFDVVTPSIAEGGASLDVAISLSAMSFMPVSLDLVTSDVEATSGQDYTMVNQHVTFAIGETQKMVSITILDDGLDEADETFGLALLNVVNAVAGMQSSTSATILDDDTPTLSFDLTTLSLSETQGVVNVAYSLDFAAYQDVTFDVASNDLTALAGLDFTQVMESVTILAGDTNGSIALTLLDDVLIESDETFRLNFSNLLNADQGNAQVDITLTSDDTLPTVEIMPTSLVVTENAGPQVITLRLSQAVNQALSLRVQTNALSATAGVDFIELDELVLFQAGEQVKTLNFTPIDDGSFELEENLTIDLAMPNGVLIDTNAASVAVTLENDDQALPMAAPNFIALRVLDPDAYYRAGDTITIEADMGEGGLMLEADLSGVDSAFGTQDAIPYFGAGVYRLTTPALDPLTMIEGVNTTIEVTAIDSLGQSVRAWLSLTIDQSAPNGQFFFNVPASSVPEGDCKVTLAFDEPVSDLPLLTLSGLGALDFTSEIMSGSLPGVRFTYTISVPNGAMGVGIVSASPNQDLAGNPAVIPVGEQLTLTGGLALLRADAGADQAISTPQSITLDGRASLGASTYLWSQVAGPSLISISNAGSDLASATIAEPGIYLFQLHVENGGLSADDTLLVTLSDGLPSVDAGADIVLAAQEFMTIGMDAFTSQGLSGSASDPDGDPLFATWMLVSSPATGNLVIVDRNALSTDLQVFGSIIEAGVYEFRLDVADAALLALGQVVSDTLRLIVIGEGTRPPSANAGENRSALVGDLIVFDGGRSTDPDAQGPAALAYEWTLVEKPASSSASLQGTTNQNTALSADAAGLYVVALVVRDADGLSSLVDHVEVTVFDPSNNLPRAGVSRSPSGAVNIGQNVTLSAALESGDVGSGGSLDFEGDSVSASWVFLDGPSSIAIANPTNLSQVFNFPMLGVYRFRVSVNDGVSDGIPTTILVEVTSGSVAMPLANASIAASDDPDGDSQVAFIPSLGVDRDINNRIINIDGSASTVANGKTASYRWTQVSGPAVGLIGATTNMAGFVPIEAGVYTFKLRVSDEDGRSNEREIEVAVDTHDAIENPMGNALPRVSAPADLMVLPDEEVNLNGSGFDPNGGNVTLRWVQVAGPPINFERPTLTSMRFTPIGEGDYVFALAAQDDTHTGLARLVRVSVREEMVVIEPPPATGGGGGGGGGGGCIVGTQSNPWILAMALLLIFLGILRQSAKVGATKR